MERIYLRRDSVRKSWVATWLGQQGEVLERAFGTATVPTPILTTAAPETVKAAIQKRNPDALVLVWEDVAKAAQ